MKLLFAMIGGALALTLVAMSLVLGAMGLRKADEAGRLAEGAAEAAVRQAAELRKLRTELAALGKPAAHAPGTPPHWGYEGDEGPEHWGKHFPTCASGSAQSPVNITGPFEKSVVALRPEYKSGELRIVNNGHTVQVNVPPGSSLRVGEDRYELLQFHFHRPSEEQVDGKPSAMVVHLVHRSAAGRLAVLGVLLRESAVQNRTLWAVWQHLPPKEGPEVVVTGVSINPAGLLPPTLGHWAYEGSLTTPPCTEGVQFFILKEPVGVQKEMLDRFPFTLNARPVQPLNGRRISAS